MQMKVMKRMLYVAFVGMMLHSILVLGLLAHIIPFMFWVNIMISVISGIMIIPVIPLLVAACIGLFFVPTQGGDIKGQSADKFSDLLHVFFILLFFVALAILPTLFIWTYLSVFAFFSISGFFIAILSGAFLVSLILSIVKKDVDYLILGIGSIIIPFAPPPLILTGPIAFMVFFGGYAATFWASHIWAVILFYSAVSFWGLCVLSYAVYCIASCLYTEEEELSAVLHTMNNLQDIPLAVQVSHEQEVTEKIDNLPAGISWVLSSYLSGTP